MILEVCNKFQDLISIGGGLVSVPDPTNQPQHGSLLVFPRVILGAIHTLDRLGVAIRSNKL